MLPRSLSQCNKFYESSSAFAEDDKRLSWISMHSSISSLHYWFQRSSWTAEAVSQPPPARWWLRLPLIIPPSAG